MVQVALAQYSGNVDKAANVKKASRMTQQAAATGARLVCFPELATTIYFCFERNPDHFGLAEPSDGPSLNHMQSVAQENDIAVVFPYYENYNGTLYNTAAVIGADGNLIGQYRKNSIPNIMRTQTTGETPADEKFYFTQSSDGFPVFDTGVGLKLGVLICYDRHFPEAARALGLQQADLVVVPTATYRPWVRHVWEIELRAHAIANNYYVGGVNKVGPDLGGAPGRHYFGDSMFVDPRGEVIARAGDTEDEIVYAEVDPAVVSDTRDLWGFFRNRRPDAYGLLTEPMDASVAPAPVLVR